MGNLRKLRARILAGEADANIDFSDLRRLLTRLGFSERIRGSHHIFTHEDAAEILNLQSKGGKAKPYQVRQVRNVLVRYRLGGDDVHPL